MPFKRPLKWVFGTASSFNAQRPWSDREEVLTWIYILFGVVEQQNKPHRSERVCGILTNILILILIELSKFPMPNLRYPKPAFPTSFRASVTVKASTPEKAPYLRAPRAAPCYLRRHQRHQNRRFVQTQNLHAPFAKAGHANPEIQNRENHSPLSQQGSLQASRRSSGGFGPWG